MPPSGKVSSSAAEQVVDIDPLLVYFTFSRIRPRFSCGRTMESTLQQFRDGELHPRDLPLLSVLTDGAHYYSQNNRRLYAYKQLKREGLLDTIPVRLRPVPRTKRMHCKYSQETCALNATLMRVTTNRDGVRDTSATREDGSNASAIEDSHNSWNACSPSLPGRCAAEPRIQGEVLEAGESSEAATGAKQEWKRQQRMDTPQQQEQQSNSSRCENVLRQQRRPKCAAAVRPPSTRSSDSDSDGNGSTSALEAELRKLGLHTYSSVPAPLVPARMPRFTSSSGRHNIVSLKRKKKSLAEAVNEQLTLTALSGGGVGGEYHHDDGYADGGVAEDFEYEDAESNDPDGNSDAERESRVRAATSAAKKSTKETAKKLSTAASSSRLRHRGPLDAGLSEGKYAATPVDVEAAMDDIFGTLDMGDIDAEGEELLDDDGGTAAEDSDTNVRGAVSTKDAVGRKRRRAKDLTEEEYAAWLEKKSSKVKKAGLLRRAISFGVDGSGVGDAVLDNEEADILRQLSELRQAQMSLVPAIGAATVGDAESAGTSNATAAVASAQSGAKQTRDVVQHFIMVYGQLLRLRVLLQPAVTKAIGMPQYYARSLFVDSDTDVDGAAAAVASDGDGAAGMQEMREDLSRHYAELQNDLEQVLATLYAAATGSSRNGSSNAHEPFFASKSKKTKVEGDHSVPSYLEVKRFHERVLRHANTCLEYWGSKLVQANSAKLKTIAQPLPQQIAAILSAKSRLRSKVQKNRSHIPIIAHPEHVRAATSVDCKAQRALHIAEGDVDDEIYDDADFLRELVRRGGAAARQLDQRVKEMQRALLPSREGVRKGFHRMTKGKAVNYEPRPKLIAFMVPEPFDETQRSEVVVKNLFQ